MTPLDVRSRRTLFEVFEGYCTYFLTILLVSTQITDLDPSYRVLVKGMFISPFSIGVLYNMARHLVGMNACTGREFEAVAAPLLLEVKALVNSPEEVEAPWSGDEALRHFARRWRGTCAYARSNRRRHRCGRQKMGLEVVHHRKRR